MISFICLLENLVSLQFKTFKTFKILNKHVLGKQLHGKRYITGKEAAVSDWARVTV